MQPTTSPIQTLFTNRKFQIGTAIGIVLVIIAYLIFSTVQNATFRITGTSPKTSDIAAISPYVKVQFNRELSKDNFRYTASDKALVDSYTISDKTVQFTFKAGVLQPKQKYTITIESVTSKDNETLKNKNIAFTPNEQTWNEMNKEEQDAIVAAQDKFGYSPLAIAYIGINNLIDQGLSSYQAQGLQKAIYEFNVSIDKEYRTILFIEDTVKLNPVQPTTNRASMFFTVSMDNVATYDAKLDFFDLTSVQLYLYDQDTGKQIFDSGVIDVYQQGG